MCSREIFRVLAFRHSTSSSLKCGGPGTNTPHSPAAPMMEAHRRPGVRSRRARVPSNPLLVLPAPYRECPCTELRRCGVCAGGLYPVPHGCAVPLGATEGRGEHMASTGGAGSCGEQVQVVGSDAGRCSLGQRYEMQSRAPTEAPMWSVPRPSAPFPKACADLTCGVSRGPSRCSLPKIA